MPHSDEGLVEFSHRLRHDLQIFFSVARSLTRTRVGLARPVAWDVETALIESFGLHARALTDFFFTKKQGRGRHDAFAFHFFDPATRWLDLVPPQGPWTARIRRRGTKGVESTVDRFGSQIAHLTFEQGPLSDFARGWPVMQVASEIGYALRVFVAHVPRARVAPGFIEDTAREIPVVARLDGSPHPMAVWTPPLMHRASTPR